MFEESFSTGGSVAGGSIRYGLVSGTVKENYDKNQPGKIKVEYYLGEQGKSTTAWVPVMTPYVAENSGFYMLPEIGTEVVVAFLNGRLESPVVIGTLWCKEIERPEKAVQEKNLTKVIRTKGGNEIRFEDEDQKQKVTVTTPGGLTLSMEDEKSVIRIQDKEGKNKMTIDAGKGEIEIKADKMITLAVGSTKAELKGNQLSMNSNKIEGTATQSLTMKGQSTLVQGSQTQVKADANMTVQAGGITEVKGSMVKIN